MKRILRDVGVVFALASTSVVFADTGLFFNVVATGSTMTIRTTIPGHTYPAAGIKLNSSGYSIVSGCTPYSNGYCLFTVSDTMPATIVVSGPPSTELKSILCLNGKGPLSCQNNNAAGERFAYVTNVTSSTVSLCSVNTSTGTLSGCGDSGATLLEQPTGMTLNPVGTFAYIANLNTGNNTVTMCSVDQTTRALGNCSDSGGTGFVSPVGVTLNKAGTIAFVANATQVSGPAQNKVSVCMVNSNGALSSCSYTGNGFNFPAGVTLNPAETRAYVPNLLGNTVSLCTVGSGGSLSCDDSASPTFNFPIDVALNAAGTRAYVANRGPDTISLCQVNPTTGVLSGCVDSGGTGFSGIADIDLSADESRMYVTNVSSNTVSVCAVNSATGLLSGCTDTGGSGFAGPYNIVLS